MLFAILSRWACRGGGIAALLFVCAGLLLTLSTSNAQAQSRDALAVCVQFDPEAGGKFCPRDYALQTCENYMPVSCSTAGYTAAVYDLVYTAIVMTSGDDDRDGVYNAEDRCPAQSGPAATAGCPDADGDGVADLDDQCPSTPGQGYSSGCPDTDGDGVDDANDDCPSEPGGGDPYGCPPDADESQTDGTDTPGTYDDSGEDASEADAPGDETMPDGESTYGGSVAQQCPNDPYRVRQHFDGEALAAEADVPDFPTPEAAIASYFAASALLPPIAATEFHPATVSASYSQYVALANGLPVAWVDLVKSDTGWFATQFVGCASFVNAHLLPAAD